ncbi:MAG: hypothetical protein ABSG86_12550 [Thermoguttaceae bacterium]
MDATDLDNRRAAAAEEFDHHEHRSDGEPLVANLGSGLTVLRDGLYTRIHEDVIRRVGLDSSLSPLSEEKSERMTKLEIELYQIVVSSLAVARRGYVDSDDGWYAEWLSRLRLGPVHSEGRVAKRMAHYSQQTPDQRRLAFSNILTAALPESRRAPLVLFRLLPSCVKIVTALAFGKPQDAGDWRKQQIEHLPAIRDCGQCRGRLLDNGVQCRACGNPLWKFEWLTAE